MGSFQLLLCDFGATVLLTEYDFLSSIPFANPSLESRNVPLRTVTAKLTRKNLAMPCHAKIDCPFNIAEFIDQITISWLSITYPSKYGFLGPAPYHVNDTGLEAQNAPTHLNPAGGIRSKMSTQ